MSPTSDFNKNQLLLLAIAAFFFFSFQSTAQNAYISFTEPLISQSEASLPERTAVESDNELIVQFNFSGAEISEVNRESVSYQYLHIPGFTKMAQPGAPALPVHNELIALPTGSISNFLISNAEYIEYSDFKIHPASKPARDTEGFPEPEFEIDPEIYNRDAFYPENMVEITDTLYVRGIPLILAQVCPVQFNPVTGIIRVYSKIEFIVEPDSKSGFEEIAQKNSLHFTNLLKRNVLNSVDIPDGIKTSSQENVKSGAKNYIIITHSAYVNQANQLADWKRQLGYSVEVVSASSWTTAEIKNAIQSRYNSWIPKPDYFVIIGDHTGSYAVPGEIRYAGYNEPFATDLYYACMDGANDWHPDMAHGRISVSTVTEAQTVVDKIINYEKNPVNNATFYTNALSCAQYQDDDNNGYADRRFCHTSEDIRNYLQNEQSYSTERIYYTTTSADITTLRYNNYYYSNGQLLPAELRSYSFNWNGGESEITSSINAGKFLVFHRDHGYVGGSGWAHPYYTTSSMNSLSNGNLLPVVFSMNCHTGEFQLSNCFAEKFIRMPGKGAVGVFAAAYYSYSGYNDGMSDGMIDAIWSDPGLYPEMGTAGTGNNYTIGPGNNIYTMGDVLNQGLYAMEQNVAWSSDRQYQYELFHWFGDPAMKIWTENPHNNIIAATHASTIDCDGSSFSISASTQGATATLVYNNSILGKTVLDASGNGNIPYIISVPGSQVKLCISKVNHKPYLSNLSITGNCSFPPSMSTGGSTAVTDNSATVTGDILDDFGSTIIESGIVYSEQPNPVIGGNNVSKVETNPCVTSGTYNLELSGLQSTTTYYYRAYAINANGTGYGSDQTFTTSCGLITLPYNENFDNSTFPDCWTQEATGGATDRWIVSNTLYSGGQAYEMMAEWEDINPATSRLITPPINTTGLTEMNLKFRHFFDDFGAGTTVKIQSSSDGNNWTDEGWLLNSGSGNLGPELVETTITNNLNSPNTYVAFVVEGNLYQFDYWYVDEVELTAPDLNTVTTTAASVSTCPGQVIVPVTVQNFTDITEFSLCLDFDENELVYDTYQNLNPQLNSGSFNLVNTGSELNITWNAGTATSITDNNLFELVFDAQTFYSQILSDLSWDEAACYYIDINNNTLYKDMVNGIITIDPIPEEADSITGNSNVCQGTTADYSINTLNNTSAYTWELNPVNAGSINGTDTLVTVDWSASYYGTAILSVYASNDCGNGNSVSLDVEVNTYPTSDAGADDLICETDNYQLSGTAQNYSSVLWTTSGDGTFDDPAILNATYTPGAGDIASGFAELSLTANQEEPCNGSDTDMMQLTIDLLPGSPETPSGPELVDVHTASSTEYSIQEVVNADEYVWELIPEEAGIISASGTTCSINWMNPPVSDTARLNVVAINNCDSNYSQALTILTYTSVGIGENQGNPAVINIVPNPAQGQFQLIIKGVEEDVNIELISGNGKMISKENMINPGKERSVKDFDLSKQPKGVYYIRIYNNGINEVRKVVVQ